MQEYNDEQVVYVERPKKKGKNRLLGLGIRLILKVVFSPLIVFILSYIYYNNKGVDDTMRHAVLVSLIVYSLLTLLSILSKGFKVMTSAMFFNLFKLIKNSFDLTLMLITLVLYWVSYIFVYGMNFAL